jgi:hypothetical protein
MLSSSIGSLTVFHDAFQLRSRPCEQDEVVALPEEVIRAREEQERAAASTAHCPEARRVHELLADQYAAMLADRCSRRHVG